MMKQAFKVENQEVEKVPRVPFCMAYPVVMPDGNARGKAGEALAREDRKWLEQLMTRREKPENFEQALERRSDDIKVVIQFSEI
jgi:hypothetical protein